MKLLNGIFASLAAWSAPLAGAWVISRRPCRLTQVPFVTDTSLPKERTLLFAGHDDGKDVDKFAYAPRSPMRRQVLQKATTTTLAAVTSVVLLAPLATVHAAEPPPTASSSSSSSNTVDPLDQLGASLSSSSPPSATPPRWPESSLSPLPVPATTSAPVGGSDLDQALQGMQKKRQIDPRTHG